MHAWLSNKRHNTNKCTLYLVCEIKRLTSRHLRVQSLATAQDLYFVVFTSLHSVFCGNIL